ncbi:MAG: hypothetical protein QOJ35_1932 [Solirubrobacteraceae bacterium]|jgi:hypothetical protein|nr:hypothetical protein [Solirubrobacteraceae bacterium]
MQCAIEDGSDEAGSDPGRGFVSSRTGTRSWSDASGTVRNVERADLWALSDDELFALIETLDAGCHERRELVAAVEELFRRIRAEAAPSERSSVEAAIDRLRGAFGQDGDDDDDGPQAAGVREPRRPPPDFNAGTLHLAS